MKKVKKKNAKQFEFVTTTSQAIRLVAENNLYKSVRRMATSK